MIDNMVSSFHSCLSNGIYIESFYGDKDDNQLLKLIPILKYLKNVNDVRVEIEKLFGLSKLYSDYVNRQKKISNYIKKI